MKTNPKVWEAYQYVCKNIKDSMYRESILNDILYRAKYSGKTKNVRTIVKLAKCRTNERLACRARAVGSGLKIMKVDLLP